MIVSIPKEIKNNENRVAVTPAGVNELVKLGHRIIVQQSAGEASGFTDEMYLQAGAELVSDIETAYEIAEMVVKVKEPVEPEYELIRKGQIIFAYFHFASSEKLTRAMIDSQSVCIAYETVEMLDGSLPLLAPMSEVAGRMAVQQGAKYLEKPFKGKGILLGGAPGVLPARVLILGGGVVGTQAAKMAAGLGADVTIMDVNLDRLRYLADIMPANVHTLMSNEYNIRKLLPTQDLVIGAALVHGSIAPKLVTRDMLKDMQKGTVVVDVAVDQGGCIETCRPTTHADPIYVVDDVIHYCVTNMPGAVPYTSTLALTNATLPFVIQLANRGWRKACSENYGLKMGLNIAGGKAAYPAVAKAFNLPFVEPEIALSTNLNELNENSSYRIKSKAGS